MPEGSGESACQASCSVVLCCHLWCCTPGRCAFSNPQRHVVLGLKSYCTGSARGLEGGRSRFLRVLRIQLILMPSKKSKPTSRHPTSAAFSCRLHVSYSTNAKAETPNAARARFRPRWSRTAIRLQNMKDKPLYANPRREFEGYR